MFGIGTFAQFAFAEFPSGGIAGPQLIYASQTLVINLQTVITIKLTVRP